jgi:hypothetical protein
MDELYPETQHSDWKVGDPEGISILQCHQCLGIEYRESINGKVIYKYYRVGKPESLDDPFGCAWGNILARMTCEHEWVTLHSDVISDKDSAEKRLGEQLKNSSLEDAGYEAEIAQDTYERVAYGESHNWCYKCGMYLIPTGKPSFKLPRSGEFTT